MNIEQWHIFIPMHVVIMETISDIF